MRSMTWGPACALSLVRQRKTWRDLTPRRVLAISQHGALGGTSSNEKPRERAGPDGLQSGPIRFGPLGPDSSSEEPGDFDPIEAGCSSICVTLILGRANLKTKDWGRLHRALRCVYIGGTI